jgi:hypothetical protein
MKEFIVIVLFGVGTVIVGASVYKSLLHYGYGVNVRELLTLLDECEAHLPRNQSCEVVISVRVKEEQ